MQTERAYDDPAALGPVERGPVPRAQGFARWVRVAEVDLAALPPVRRWDCLRTPEAITVDGRLDEAVWSRARWSEPFGMIHDGSPTPLATRCALLWDDAFLHVGYRVEDPDIRASMTGFNDHVYRHDEDVEFFFAGDGHYFEIGLNALNTSYQIRWTWIERLVREQRFAELEALFKLPDVLYYVAREGERLGRWADLSYRMPGLRHAVHIDGSLNCPEVRDRGWTVEMALPWAGLAGIAGGRPLPPAPGASFRMTAYRCHHDRVLRRAKGWAWSIQGNDNIHIPERWTEVTFRAESA
ncbi:MAG: carbohydrate-binding family 9-like protein [Rhodobacteraceae bacterium]|nr:carbohydrate-binding family 9-like protein [Paracoccaceae bacterium]